MYASLQWHTYALHMNLTQALLISTAHNPSEVAPRASLPTTAHNQKATATLGTLPHYAHPPTPVPSPPHPRSTAPTFGHTLDHTWSSPTYPQAGHVCGPIPRASNIPAALPRQPRPRSHLSQQRGPILPQYLRHPRHVRSTRRARLAAPLLAGTEGLARGLFLWGPRPRGAMERGWSGPGGDKEVEKSTDAVKLSANPQC